MSLTNPLPRSILVTGAAGRLGSQVARYLQTAVSQGLVDRLRLLDIQPVDMSGPGIEVVQAPLSEPDIAYAAAEGMNAIVHLAGIPIESEWQDLIPANIAATTHLYDAAVIHGVDRVLFASSNHAVGFYPVTQRIDHTAPGLADSRYGLTKLFGEELARLYALKTGLRSFCMRIGSCFDSVTATRQLKTYQSFDDFVRLVEVGLKADYRFEIVYGISDIADGYWDNTNALALGYVPRDLPADFVSPDLDPSEFPFHGGPVAADAMPGLSPRPGLSRDAER